MDASMILYLHDPLSPHNPLSSISPYLAIRDQTTYSLTKPNTPFHTHTLTLPNNIALLAHQSAITPRSPERPHARITPNRPPNSNHISPYLATRDHTTYSLTKRHTPPHRRSLTLPNNISHSRSPALHHPSAKITRAPKCANRPQISPKSPPNIPKYRAVLSIHFKNEHSDRSGCDTAIGRQNGDRPKKRRPRDPGAPKCANRPQISPNLPKSPQISRRTFDSLQK